MNRIRDNIGQSSWRAGGDSFDNEHIHDPCNSRFSPIFFDFSGK